MRSLVGYSNKSRLVELFIGSGSVNRSFLITGPKSCGKTFFGKYMAQRILGSDRVWRNAHADFFFIRLSDGTWADEVENFLLSSAKQPFEGSNVVVFFDDVHLVPPAGQAKLLKVVEEPFPKTTIILSSPSQFSILGTIVSRTTKIALSERSIEEKRDILLQHSVSDAEERLKVSHELSILLADDYEARAKRIAELRSDFMTMMAASDLSFKRMVWLFALERQDLREFLSSLLGLVDDVKFNLMLHTFLGKLDRAVNLDVICFSFFTEARREFERLTQESGDEAETH